MRRFPKFPLFLLALASVLPLASSAHAATRTFAANSLIIPMDFCYQAAKSQTNVQNTPSYCTYPTNNNQNDGILLAYGMVYRLVENGITVYVILNPTKTSMIDVDATVTAPSGSPVKLVTTSTGATSEFMTVGSTIQYRGMPFMIDASQAAAALALLKSSTTFNPTFNGVVVHVAKESFQAPVTLTLSQKPPKLALLNLGGSAENVLTQYLQSAGLGLSTDGGVYGQSSGDIYDTFNNDTDFTNGGLLSGGYRILWAPHWDGDNSESAVYLAIRQFITAGNAYFSECASVQTQEGAYQSNGGGNGQANPAAAGNANFMSTAGVYTNGLGGGFPQNNTPTDFWAFGDLTNVLVQYGDFGFVAQGGSVQNWQPAASVHSVYKPGVSRLIYSSSATVANQNWDVFTFTHLDGVSTEGPVIYLGGHSYQNVVAGTRLVLNTLLLLGQAYLPNVELSRSSPVIYSDGTTFQGSYNSTTSNNTYPPTAGHFRQFPAGSLAGDNVTAFSSITSNWDAATLVPSAANRTVFTVAAQNSVMTQTSFTTANVALLNTPMGMTVANATVAINGILAGVFGGVDHSTPAIVGASTVVTGGATRPVVAYVGGLDGMLHAIAVSGTGVTPGQEMWAFIPPSQLAKIGVYTGGVDGAPQVADAFVDPTHSGIRTWKTLLSITNGAFGGTVDVLDVSDPTHPAWLWTGASGTVGTSSYVMGAAEGSAFGFISGAAGPQSVVYLASNNAGTGGNGFNLYALDAGTGSLVWQWNRLYTQHIPSTSTLVPNDVPGVPAVFNMAGNGGYDDTVVFGDLDGKIWSLSAALGTAPTTPLWNANADGYPFAAGVAIYRDRSTGDMAAVGATSGRDWVPSTITPYLVGVDLQNGNKLIQTNLTAGERVYALPTIVGNDVYLITSFGTFNGNISNSTSDAGNLRRINLSSGTITLTSAVKKGDSEVAVDANDNLVASSAAGETSMSNSGNDTNALAMNNKARPFTVQTWLDFR